jgi:hypothetical protein
MFGPRTFPPYFLAWTLSDFLNFCTSQCSLFDRHNSGYSLCSKDVQIDILAKIDQKSRLHVMRPAFAIIFEICTFEIMNKICDPLQYKTGYLTKRGRKISGDTALKIF